MLCQVPQSPSPRAPRECGRPTSIASVFAETKLAITISGRRWLSADSRARNIWVDDESLRHGSDCKRLRPVVV